MYNEIHNFPLVIIIQIVIQMNLAMIISPFFMVCFLLSVLKEIVIISVFILNYTLLSLSFFVNAFAEMVGK
ncbi:hypothetical protein HMPREF3191_00984 [Veillonellaceae bacterium DNF00626]|nr:hypothetical protein HMPREF3191_00984 [Veillonellaceae bacterium DNF00626]